MVIFFLLYNMLYITRRYTMKWGGDNIYSAINL